MKKIFAVCFMLVLSVILVSIGGAGIQFVHSKLSNSVQSAESWNALEEYPFPQSAEAQPNAKEETSKRFTTKITDTVESLKSNILSAETFVEKAVTTGNPFYHDFVYLHKAFDKRLGKNMTTSQSGTTNDPLDSGDIVLDLSDNYFAFVMDDIDISDPLNAVTDFADKMQKRGIPFLYFNTPLEIGEDSIEAYKAYAAVYPDATPKKEQQILDTLKAHNVPVVSLEKICPDICTNTRPYFFQTDHHWLPQTGLKANQALAEALNEQCGYHIDTSMFDLKNYTISKTFPSFGSEGRKATDVYATPDEVPILVPKYATDLSVRICHNGTVTKRTGSAEETLYQYSQGKNEDLYNRNAYAVYTDGDQSLIQIHNNHVHDGTHLLLIKLSQANCMIPSLANAVEYLDVIDARYFHGSLQTFIEKEQPDTIVMVYGTRAFYDTRAFHFD